MPGFRVKLTAAKGEFLREIQRLEHFDAENQRRFVAMVGKPNGLSRKQLHLLTESVFFRGFREWEQFVRDVFLLYTLEKKPSSGKRVTSYLRPKNFAHAEQLIQSSMQFLDWTSPERVIERAELYLKDGFPVKLPISTSVTSLRDYKRIRNHIAHNSVASLQEYKKVLNSHLGVVPLRIPSPGEFLLIPERGTPNRYKLQTFFGFAKAMASAMT